MRRLHDWFLERPDGHSLLSWLPIIVGFELLLSSLGISLVEALSLSENLSEKVIDFPMMVKEDGILYVLGLLPFLAAFEEFLFRFLPLGVVMWLAASGRERSIWFATALILALLSSVAFGFMHGGIGNIFIQGVGGLIYATVFLKWSALGKHPVKGLMASTATHASCNAVAVTLFYLKQ